MPTRESRRVLLDLQDLRSQLSRRLLDKQFEQRGGAVFYAVDNDVLTTVTAPWDTPHQIYLRQLTAGDSEAQESLAYILAEYMFRIRSQSPKLPFVILKPGDAELEGVWNRVYRNAQLEDDSIGDELHKVVDLAKNFTGKTPETLYQLVRKLLECLQHRKGAIAQLHRIVRLQDSGSALPATRVLLNDRALLPQPDERDLRILKDLESSWLEALNRSRPPGRPGQSLGTGGISDFRDRVRLPTNNDIDAAVMAQVEWINLQFASTEFEYPRRLCFLTGDRHIERIARSRRIAMDFIRNPSCFLADEDFFKIAGVPTPDFLARPQDTRLDTKDPAAAAAQPENSGNSLIEWLSLILPDLGKAQWSRDALLRLRVDKEIARASAEWGNYLKSAAAGAGFREANVDFQEKVLRLASTLFNVQDASEFGATLARLRKQAHEKGNEAMTRFGVSGVMASFLTLDQDEKWPGRNMPAVRMDSWSEATQVIVELMQAESLQAAQYRLIESRVRALREEDGTGYTVFVIYALAFAFAGKWDSALRVSRAALSISSHYVENEASDSRVRGVEAAYLCAVFSRYNAKDPKALDECQAWLDTARERSGASRGGPRDVRFDVEELAIRVSGVNFAVFIGQDGDLRGQLLQYRPIRDLCQSHLDLLELAANDSSPQVANALQQQLATNFLQLQLLAKLRGTEQDLLPVAARDMLRVLEAVADLGVDSKQSGVSRRPAAALTRFIFVCASAVFYPPAAGWNLVENRERLLADLSSFGEKLDVMPYDALRVGRMMDLVARGV